MSYFVEKREGKRKTSYRVQIIIKQDRRILHRDYQVHEVPAFSLHRSWATLKRYTNIKPEEVELR